MEKGRIFVSHFLGAGSGKTLTQMMFCFNINSRRMTIAITLASLEICLLD